MQINRMQIWRTIPPPVLSHSLITRVTRSLLMLVHLIEEAKPLLVNTVLKRSNSFRHQETNCSHHPFISEKRSSYVYRDLVRRLFKRKLTFVNQKTRNLSLLQPDIYVNVAFGEEYQEGPKLRNRLSKTTMFIRLRSKSPFWV